MNMTDDERKALVKFRVQKAHEAWEETMTGKISQELNQFYVELFELRQRGDYDDYVSVGASDVMPLVDTAEEYMNTVEGLIRESMNL